MAQGDYSGPGFVNLTNAPHWIGLLRSTGDPDQTIIDLEGNRFFTGTLNAQGITLRNGSVAIESGDPELYNCYFENNNVAINHTGVFIFMDVSHCLFQSNDTAIITESPWQASVGNCTFLHNELGLLVIPGPETWVSVYSSVFAFNVKCLENMYFAGACIFYRNDMVGDASWRGCLLFWENTIGPSKVSSDGVRAISTFIFADPLFCDTTLMTGADVYDNSPCLPGNNSCSTLIGNVQIGCLCCQDYRGNVDYVTGPGGPIDVSDLSYLVDYLFKGGAEPPCEEEANVDGIIGPGGPIDVADLSYLVDYLFKGGPQPPDCPGLSGAI